MYEQVTSEAILKRMLYRVPSRFDKREGSVIWDAHSPAAIELQLLYRELDAILREAYGDTASRKFFVLRCKERGLTPCPATHAILKGVFTPAAVDVLGKRFSIETRNYVVTEQLADGAYLVQCEEAGRAGNQYLGRMIPVEYITGLASAELTEIRILGEDEEETEALRQRYFDSFGDSAFGGNVRDYLLKTNAIPGVGAAKAKKLTTGGTVKLTILDSEFGVPADTLIDAVQTAIDPEINAGEGYGLAPIGHVVTVEKAEAVAVSVKTLLTFGTGFGWENLQVALEETVSNYFTELRRGWGDAPYLIVRISQIESRILAVPGVIDIQDTCLNGSPENLALTQFQVPVFGGVGE
ncbi:phage tail protein [Butyricicoccus sp. 1XD8-22]|nr:phage tail protein [Butyricicoccus sp. 1XD8-22]